MSKVKSAYDRLLDKLSEELSNKINYEILNKMGVYSTSHRKIKMGRILIKINNLVQ
jgi:nucleoid DNA-binding protein